MLDQGDSVRADKDFDVQCLSPWIWQQTTQHYLEKQIKYQENLSSEISSKRVHVERIKGLAKIYKIRVSSCHRNNMFCFIMLTNFRKRIFPKKAQKESGLQCVNIIFSKLFWFLCYFLHTYIYVCNRHRWVHFMASWLFFPNIVKYIPASPS